MSGTEAFLTHAPAAWAQAYRLTGSAADADDVMQDTWLRWQRAGDGPEEGRPREPRAFLLSVATRLALDRLRHLKRARVGYPGPWLPEPLVSDIALPEPGGIEAAETLSLALLRLMERLPPSERAALLLVEVAEMSPAEAAAALGIRDASLRQRLSRARRRLAAARAELPALADPLLDRSPGSPAADPDAARRLAEAVLDAVAAGDDAALRRLFAADVVLESDGGGKAAAALNPIRGIDKVIRFLLSIHRKNPTMMLRLASVNGHPGFVQHLTDGTISVTALVPDGQGRVGAILTMRNPDKLTAIRPVPPMDPVPPTD
ncbi:RNA polymerase sigma24 factor [Tistrella bauzanensis]|uniref:RNA polymerase sigma24 factor n=1 Tax=Tistrella bauzanensis TaxID=657419 RepID=A0ABQ1IHP1_9PROT|nr:sigma-70 family RNA polymerase sigma factor [Tistrella bauzanensis]GGB38529.1 RNA polymerase sigma24 factor [Tistrella bauzanensis]